MPEYRVYLRATGRVEFQVEASVNPPEQTYIFDHTYPCVDLLESRVLDVLNGWY